MGQILIDQSVCDITEYVIRYRQLEVHVHEFAVRHVLGLPAVGLFLLASQQVGFHISLLFDEILSH